MKGFQLRYIYLVDRNARLAVPSIPFSQIDEAGAGMYKGKTVTLKERREEKQ